MLPKVRGIYFSNDNGPPAAGLFNTVKIIDNLKKEIIKCNEFMNMSKKIFDETFSFAIRCLQTQALIIFE